MANTKYNADGNALTVWWALPNAFANPAKPALAEMNAITNVTRSISWENFSFGAQASTQTSDPSIGDVGNVQQRGFAQFGGTVTFFYPSNYTDTSDPFLTTFNLLRTPRTLGYLVMRVDGVKTTAGITDASKGAVANDFLQVYKVMSDGWSDVNVGDNSFKYTVTFQPQGDLWFNVMVATTVTVVTPTPIGATAYTVGGRTPLGTYLTGRQLAAVSGQWNGYPGAFTWESSNPATASVDRNGVVLGIAGGTTNIIARDVNTGVASSPLAITIA